MNPYDWSWLQETGASRTVSAETAARVQAAVLALAALEQDVRAHADSAHVLYKSKDGVVLLSLPVAVIRNAAQQVARVS